jgi:CRP/FNR family transcriptional regulator
MTNPDQEGSTMHSAAYHDCVSPGYADRGTPPTFNARHPRIELPDLNGELIALQSKEALFLAGEKKDEFYRVDAGVLLISTPETDGSLGESRLAFPGEYLGLGFLSEHPSSARAIVASTVSSYPLNKVDETSEHCPVLRQKLNEAVQLEFNQLREKAVANGHRAPPIVRVANFLVAASHIALLEGRCPNLTSDSITPGVLAGLLNLDQDVLIAAFTQMMNDQLISCDPDFRVTIGDLKRLGALAAV